MQIPVTLSLFLAFSFSSCTENNEIESYSDSMLNKKQVLNKEAIIQMKNCSYTQLSSQFDLRFDYKRSAGEPYTTKVSVYLNDKTTKQTCDSFLITSDYLYFDLDHCKDVVSYSTQFNMNFEISDNYYGFLVVADYNFDGLDDVAIIRDNGGNGGPLYNFYVQQKNKKFVLDAFLSDELIFFPNIDAKNKTLTTTVHANSCGVTETVFNFNAKKNTWSIVKSRYINYCDGEE